MCCGGGLSVSELMFPDRGCSSGPAGCFRTGRDSGFQVLDSSFRVRDSERRIFVAKFQGRSKSWKGEARPKPHKTPDLNYLEFLYMLNPTPSSLICMYIYICIYYIYTLNPLETRSPALKQRPWKANRAQRSPHSRRGASATVLGGLRV